MRSPHLASLQCYWCLVVFGTLASCPFTSDQGQANTPPRRTAWVVARGSFKSRPTISPFRSRASQTKPCLGMEVLLEPPGQPGKAYRLGPLWGEVNYIPCSKSATRLLVTGKESDGAFAVVNSGGSHDNPIGFHSRRKAHDVFLCIKGRINVWGGQYCRTVEPGDFASVPPV